jgi:V/A-type H+-transporting ATPase subunit A
LQQDAFDPVDATMSRERQVESFVFLKQLIDTNYGFDDRDTARDFFTKLTSLYKNWNYSPVESNDYTRLRDEIRALAESYESHPERRSAGR